MKLWEFLPELSKALEEQLKADDVRWGDTWLDRTREGQEKRIYADFDKYWVDFQDSGTPIPWLKIIGNAFIGWMRETAHPELWEK